MKKTWQIAWKDLREHSKAWLLIVLVVSTMANVLPLFNKSLALHGELYLTFLFNLNLVTSIAIPHWLIAREKERKTFTILKGLPISGSEVIRGKFFAAFAMAEGTLVASMASSYYVLGFVKGSAVDISASNIILLNLSLLVILSVLLFSFMVADPRIATMIPLGAVFLLVLGGIEADKLLEARGISLTSEFTRAKQNPLFQVAAIAVFVGIVLTSYAVSTRYFERHDASELVR